MKPTTATETTDSVNNSRLIRTISASSIRNLLTRSMSSSTKEHHKQQTTSKSPKKSSKLHKLLFTNDSENIPPINSNIVRFSDPPLSSHTFPKSPSSKSPRSNAHPPLHEEEVATGSDGQGEVSQAEPLDPPVKVVVRIRPVNDPRETFGDQTVRKLSSDSLSIGDRNFTFDSVIDSRSNQEDVFQLVGVPLVKSALAGYNASIFSYGQTGSGKTYTMWGPPSAMMDDLSSASPTSSHQGIVPRIFQMLFSEIQKEQERSQEKQINYQCRCSFLEVYSEQIGDLLDPVQRNLEIRDDSKNGLYVENLTEEYVISYEDMTQILIKGLSNRKVGATSINSKSSRSHVVFTFIIESWCKETSSKCFSSSKISKITLVDLAGLDGNKVEDDDRQVVREGKNVKKSLSQLGQLVNALANETQPGKYEDMPYIGSCLTRLLRESLGGNAKLTVICNISSDNRNNVETLRTLRFGQRVKSIKNTPVINEISEDDVNDLSDQIRQLKDELIRAKSDAHNSVGSKKGYFNGRNVRDSLNHLRVSLNRSLMLPRIDDNSDNEVNADENDVKELHQQLKKLHSSCEKNAGDVSDNEDSVHFSSVEESFKTDVMSEDEVNGKEITIEERNVGKHEESVTSEDFLGALNSSQLLDPPLRTSISIVSLRQSSVLQEPMLSESPKIGTARKSMAVSFSVGENNVSESSNFKSLRQSECMRWSSLQSSKLFPGPTESLAASLHRGLQIIDSHQRNSASNSSSVAFSFGDLTLKPSPEADRGNASVQNITSDPSATLLCASCKQNINDDSNEVQDSLKTWIVEVEGAKNPNQLMNQVPKDVENNSSEASNRAKELENICMEQAAKIERLNEMLEQYKHEKEILGNNEEGIPRDSLKNQIVLFDEESRKEECDSYMKDQNKLSTKFEDKQENINEKCEIKEIQEMMDHGNTHFDTKEKEALLEEIQSLRAKLQSYEEPATMKSTEMLRSSLLARSFQLRKSVDTRTNSQEELENERQRWMEMESDWISLTDGLRIEIESIRQRAEKVEMELRLEKKCTEELDDALHRSVLGHGRMVEHYAELQEKYNDLLAKHRAMMEGVAELKRAVAKAGTRGGARFAKSLAAELSALRVEREREKEFLRKENKSLKIQLRDTAEAVHAAGELLVRLREAEQAASLAEENFTNVQQENDKLKKQVEKIKRKHKMEMVTMKQYLAESRLPESALQPLYRDDSDVGHSTGIPDDDQAWRAEFGAIYSDHY